jgi:hypothetical protein
MMPETINLTTPQDATVYAEVIIGIDLGEGETETDYSYAYFKEAPAEEEIQALVPEGWYEISRHVLLTEPDSDGGVQESHPLHEVDDEHIYPEHWYDPDDEQVEDFGETWDE